MKIRILLLLCFGHLWANGGDTLVLHPDGKELKIPHQVQARAKKGDPWDSTVTTPLPSWNALVSVAEGLEECKKDWNRLLELGQQKDSLCKAEASVLRQQSELEAERNQNYQASWKELQQVQSQCQQALGRCTELGKETEQKLEAARKSYWWAWILTGLVLGFGAGTLFRE